MGKKNNIRYISEKHCPTDPIDQKPGFSGLKVIAIDPGVAGAIVVTDGVGYLRHYPMPLTADRQTSYLGVFDLLRDLREEHGALHVFLERAVPMAMGSKSAFNYGRGFESIVIAVTLHQFPVTHVEPSKWTKEMHEGISVDLKPKVRSLKAVERLYPQLVGMLPRRPKKGDLQDGPIDALLIAGYGLRKLTRALKLTGVPSPTPKPRKPRISQPGANGGKPKKPVLRMGTTRKTGIACMPIRADGDVIAGSGVVTVVTDDGDVGDFF